MAIASCRCISGESPGSLGPIDIRHSCDPNRPEFPGNLGNIRRNFNRSGFAGCAGCQKNSEKKQAELPDLQISHGAPKLLIVIGKQVQQFQKKDNRLGRGFSRINADLKNIIFNNSSSSVNIRVTAAKRFVNINREKSGYFDRGVTQNFAGFHQKIIRWQHFESPGFQQQRFAIAVGVNVKK